MQLKHTQRQRYSNTDKHRAVRIALGRTLEGQHPTARRVEQGMNWSPLEPGSLLAEGIDTRPQAVDLQTAVFVQRADADVWVPPGKELGQIHRYVSDVLIPRLITGGLASPSLPREIRLDDTGETAEQRVESGGGKTADERLAEEAWQEVIAMQQEPRQWIPRTTGE